MRGIRIVVLATLAIGSVWLPTAARANGGAYIELDRTYYVPGDAAAAKAYVYVPDKKASILERGPFFAYLLPKGAAITEGRPVPDQAISVGAMTVEKERKESYELTVGFTMPQLQPGPYTIGVCNVPCTIVGFREPLSGSFTIAATAREAALLKQNSALLGTIAGLERQLKKADRGAQELQAELTEATSAREALTADAADLRDRLAQAAAAPAPAGRPLIDRWLVIAVLGALLLVAALVARPRRRAKVRSGSVTTAVPEEPAPSPAVPRPSDLVTTGQATENEVR